MIKHVILGLALAACSTPAETATAPQREPLTARDRTTPAHVTATLSEAGSCVAHTCTMQFAVHARGNTSTLTAKRCHDATCPTRSGQLTAAAQSEASKLARQLAELKLEPVYGSPGSADGPIYVALVHHADGTESKHVLDPMEPDLLPPPLGQAADLIKAVSDALGRCESTALVQIEQGCADVERQDGDQPIGRP